MITITSCIFINIFQMVHFSVVKFDRYLSSHTKISESLKKSEAVGQDRAPLSVIFSNTLLHVLIMQKHAQERIP